MNLEELVRLRARGCRNQPALRLVRGHLRRAAVDHRDQALVEIREQAVHALLGLAPGRAMAESMFSGSVSTLRWVQA